MAVVKAVNSIHMKNTLKSHSSMLWLGFVIREIDMVLWGTYVGYGRVKAHDHADISKLAVDQVENPMHYTARLVSTPQRDHVTRWRIWNLRLSNGV